MGRNLARLLDSGKLPESHYQVLKKGENNSDKTRTAMVAQIKELRIDPEDSDECPKFNQPEVCQ